VGLLEPRLGPLFPAAPEPAADRAPESLAAGVAEPLRGELERLLGPGRVLGRASDLIRYASDASPYRLFPRAVVMAHDADDVARVMGYGRRARLSVTFRAGGTSLNGQSQGDGILVDVRRHFTGVAVEERGASVRVGPGNVLGHVNRVLAPYGRRLGPDPASTDIATVGGVIANNSGGMRCGVARDSYRTVRSLTFALPSGTVIDTAEPGAAERFAAAEPALAEGLAAIRDEIRADAELSERIRRKFEIKNTMGYRLCAFLDADEPVEIFRRLLVGSEGTLAFVAEAVFETVPVPSRTTVSWAHFEDIDAAIAPVGELVAAGARAVELMVAPALIVASHNIAGTPESWRELPPTSAVLLVELGADGEEELDALEAKASGILAAHDPLFPPAFTREPDEIGLAWRVREGMHGLVGMLRPPGTALIMEDVCVRPERIAEAAKDLQALLTEHGFLPGVAGHASAGNLHFMLTPDFAKPEDVERYEAFMGKLVELIVGRYDGSLKAEHGTGVNMAPYLALEWGEKATELMWRAKQLADPDGVLAPGVVLNRDLGVHLRNLKTTPQIEEAATTCVECGFCEPVCPSRLLTTTPRQRIVLRREMARQPADSRLLAKLVEEYEYDGMETCAADGTCRLACPLGIDTGTLVKDLRARQRTPRGERAALAMAKRWRRVEKAARGGLRAGAAVRRVAGDAPVRAVSRGLRAALGGELVPEWGDRMPPAASPRLPSTARAAAEAVYLPACVNRIFGRSPAAGGTPGLPEALVGVSRRAGLPVWIPPDTSGHCCGLPWSSKGFREGAAEKMNQLAASLWRWSDGGRLPVVLDASSCTHAVLDPPPGALGEENRERHDRIEVLDSIDWCRDRLLPRLEVGRKVDSVAVHPTCSTRHMGSAGALEEIAGALADDVFVPPTATCCGFAGDRGFLHPELAEAATRAEAAEVRLRRFDAYLSSNRTCEIGLERATGEPYESFVFLLERATRRA
jgi:D-lactate dehydrogenase